MNDIQGYYKALGLNHTATPKEIKSAYHRMARDSHPDKAPQDKSSQKAATEKFQKLQEAYEVLSDPQKKLQYDQGQQANTQNPFTNNSWSYSYTEPQPAIRPREQAYNAIRKGNIQELNSLKINLDVEMFCYALQNKKFAVAQWLATKVDINATYLTESGSNWYNPILRKTTCFHELISNADDIAIECLLNIPSFKINNRNSINLISHIRDHEINLTPLAIAIYKQWPKELLAKLIAKGASCDGLWIPNIVYHMREPLPALLQVSAEYCAETLQMLLDNGMQVNVVDSKGRNALYYALAYNRYKTIPSKFIKIVKTLLQAGININAKFIDDNGKLTDTLTMVASMQIAGLMEVFAEHAVRLYASGANYRDIELPFEINKSYRLIPALAFFAATNDKDKLQALLNNGMPVNVVDEHGRNALYYALAYKKARGSKDVEIVTTLLQAGININAEFIDDSGKKTDALNMTDCTEACYYAILEHLSENAVKLFSNGANYQDIKLQFVYRKPGGYGMRIIPALLFFAAKNDTAKLQTLLDNGMPVNVVDSRGNNALFYALKYVDNIYDVTKTMRLLLENGINVNEPVTDFDCDVTKYHSILPFAASRLRSGNVIDLLLDRNLCTPPTIDIINNALANASSFDYKKLLNDYKANHFRFNPFLLRYHPEPKFPAKDPWHSTAALKQDFLEAIGILRDGIVQSMLVRFIAAPFIMIAKLCTKIFYPIVSRINKIFAGMRGAGPNSADVHPAAVPGSSSSTNDTSEKSTSATFLPDWISPLCFTKRGIDHNTNNTESSTNKAKKSRRFCWF